MVVHDIREDAEHVTATSVSSHRNLYKQHPQQQQHSKKQQCAFDEWEAAIVKSMSERPDEIIDILERYAVEREQLSMQEGDEWYAEEEEERSADESREDAEGSAQRDAMSSRSGWSTARESFVAAFVEELRDKVARLTYESSALVAKPVNSGAYVSSLLQVTSDKKDVAVMTNLQADLEAERIKSKSLSLHLEESKAIYEGQLQEMRERIQWLESKAALADTETAVSKREEASQTEMTVAVDDEATVITTNAKEDIIQERQDKVSVLTKATKNLKVESITLKDRLSVTGKNQELGSLAISRDSKQTDRVKELEIELENTQNQLYEMQCRCRDQDDLIHRSEDVLEMQRKKLDTSERALMKLRELYEYEKAARHSIERISDTTQFVMEKLHRKVAERRYEIDQLRNLLAQEAWVGHEIV
jgi:hypothetical protein